MSVMYLGSVAYDVSFVSSSLLLFAVKFRRFIHFSCLSLSRVYKLLWYFYSGATVFV